MGALVSSGGPPGTPHLAPRCPPPPTFTFITLLPASSPHALPPGRFDGAPPRSLPGPRSEGLDWSFGRCRLHVTEISATCLKHVSLSPFQGAEGGGGVQREQLEVTARTPTGWLADGGSSRRPCRPDVDLMLSFPPETTLQVAAHRSDPPCFVRHLGMRLGDFEAKLPASLGEWEPSGRCSFRSLPHSDAAAARAQTQSSSRPQDAPRPPLLPPERPRAFASFGSKSRRQMVTAARNSEANSHSQARQGQMRGMNLSALGR